MLKPGFVLIYTLISAIAYKFTTGESDLFPLFYTIIIGASVSGVFSIYARAKYARQKNDEQT